MRKNFIFILISFLSLCAYSAVNASPWFTGPLLAPAGKTIPLGHANFEMYGFTTNRTSYFNSHGKKINIPKFNSIQANPVLTCGLADWVDMQLSLPYTINHSLGFGGKHVGDTSMLLGFQALRQKPDSWIPDLRISLQELFPTGRFEGINAPDKNVSSTGAGTYQNVVALNFQYLKELNEINYFRTRLSLAYLHGQPYLLNDNRPLSDPLRRHGVVKPGDLYSADLSGEFTLTQNLVAVMEAYYFYHTKSSFGGDAAISENGQLTRIGQDPLNSLSLAPALEYNFTSQYGIIAGPWFAVQGKNSSVFTSFVIAFDAFW